MAAKTLVLLVVAAAAAVTGTSTLENRPDARNASGAAAPTARVIAETQVVAAAAVAEPDLLHPTAQRPRAVASQTPTLPLPRPTSRTGAGGSASRPGTSPTTRARAPQHVVKQRPATPPRSTTAHRPAATPPAATRPKPSGVTGPTGWPALNAAIARIPGYRPGGITWTVSSRYGHWGATDMATGWIYISPSVSPGLLDSVVRHEYAHIVTVRAYAGDWRTAKQAANLTFGGTGRTGVERAADCMARALGASFTQYTSCGRADWQAAAGRLLAGRRL